MRAFFSTLSSCWFWLLFGVLIGWLLNRFLCKCTQKPHLIEPNSPIKSPVTKPEIPPSAKLADMPATAVITPAATAKGPAVKAAAVKPKQKPAPKTTVKPKVESKQTTKASSSLAIDLVAAKTAGFNLKNVNDLTAVEGIGPKINALFLESGIQTFTQLAELSEPQMRAILDKGGARYRIANPSSWAKQAKLASVNKWAELKTLQDTLSGGVKK